MRMILADWHAETATPAVADPYTAATIKSKVDAIVTAAQATASGITSYTAIYVDGTGTPNGSKTVQGGDFGVICKTATQTSCTAGVKVTPLYSHSTFLFAAIGTSSASESAVATSLINVAGPVVQPFQFWSVWYKDCLSAGTPDISKGSDVTYHVVNGWEKHNPNGPGVCGDPTPPSNNAAYKGFLGNPVLNCDGSTASTVSPGSCLQTTTGNGTKPDTLLHANIYMFPVFSVDSGGQLTVLEFAAVRPDSDGSDTGTIEFICGAGSSSSVCTPGAGAPVSVTGSGFLK